MRTERWVIAGAVAAVLAGCGGGAEEIASPGSGGNITINNPPANNPTNPDPQPTDPNLATAAIACPIIGNPVQLKDEGPLTTPTGTYRVCTLPTPITSNTVLERIPGVLYALNGRVDVGPDRGAAPTTDPAVVLTIRPGVIIFAQTGTSWLAVNRGNQIQAVGSAALPIVFTSRDNVLGIASDDSHGQWGGVVLLGRAPITDCTVAPAATPGTVNCERQTEGAVDPAYFGGATPTDNSGTIDYVQIRYSGYVLSGNSELQSLTLGGVGSGTKIDHFQSHNSSDDGFENFGGTANMRHLVITGADDDSIDVDTGYRGTIQHVIAVQKTAGAADSMIELDSANTLEDNTPRTFLKLANFTFIHRNSASGNNAAMLFRGKADAALVNGVVTSPLACLRLAGANILTADAPNQKVGPPTFSSVVMQCATGGAFLGSSGVTTPQVADTFNAGTNNNAAFTTSLTGAGNNPFINGANETAVTATNPTTIDGAFDETTHVGAVKDANDTWYAGWTCNSATANFGATGTACTSLPKLTTTP